VRKGYPSKATELPKAMTVQYQTLISSSLTALGVRAPVSVISAETRAGGCWESAGNVDSSMFTLL
jgi:hypothetical protein